MCLEGCVVVPFSFAVAKIEAIFKIPKYFAVFYAKKSVCDPFVLSLPRFKPPV
jgi:hypothetical protein